MPENRRGIFLTHTVLHCITSSNNMLTLKTHHSVGYSRSISFFSWCLTQRPVGEWGHPMSVRRQYEQTEASRVKARRSELLDLPDLYGWLSSSPSKSVWYSMRNALISTASSISTGRSLTDVYSNNITRTFLTAKSVLSHWFIHISL